MREIDPRKILPMAVAVLGELGECVLHNPQTQAFFALPYEPGRILCASDDGRQMFVVRPIGDAGPVRMTDQALHAARLHERFVGAEANGFFNCRIPRVRKPVYRGQLVIVRYYAQKFLDEDTRPAVWEHYFAEDGVQPAYADLWSLGHGQFWIPPGRWCVDEAGIRHHDTRSFKSFSPATSSPASWLM